MTAKPLTKDIVKELSAILATLVHLRKMLKQMLKISNFKTVLYFRYFQKIN